LKHKGNSLTREGVQNLLADSFFFTQKRFLKPRLLTVLIIVLIKKLVTMLYCKKRNMANLKTPKHYRQKGVREEAGLENRPILLTRGGGRGRGRGRVRGGGG
jgi:hypothetical protein